MHDRTMLLIYSMPKLVPFALRMNGTSNIGIARLTWSHLINMCGTRASAKGAGIATVFPLRHEHPGEQRHCCSFTRYRKCSVLGFA